MAADVHHAADAGKNKKKENEGGQYVSFQTNKGNPWRHLLGIDSQDPHTERPLKKGSKQASKRTKTRKERRNGVDSHVSQTSQQDVDEEVGTTTSLKEDTERGPVRVRERRARGG